MFHIATGGYHDSGFRVLMIVFRWLCYTAILKQVLPSVHYNGVNVNICISME